MTNEASEPSGQNKTTRKGLRCTSQLTKEELLEARAQVPAMRRRVLS